MDTYRPEEQGVSQSNAYGNNGYGSNNQYGYEPNYNTAGGYNYNSNTQTTSGYNYNPNAQSAGEYNPNAQAAGGYNYDPNPYATGGYGANGYTQNGYDMGGGYESGNPVQMSGIRNLANIVSNEVVAKSYLFMMVALFITAGAALTTSPAFAMRIILSRGYWAFVVAEIAIVCGANSAITKNKPIIAGVLFAVYSYMTGMLFSIFFVIYTGESLASVFFMCAGMFAVMAIYGMVTGKDLSSLGSICMMGLVGIIIAGVVNLVFIRSGMFDFIVSVVGVLVFVGLTAYDANKTKRLALTTDSDNAMSIALYCALELYLDFINLFLKLLQLFGKRK